ncbi:MAG: sigma-54-dependent transcriptional regulator [Deltaproteobacteria bacterium]
MSLEPEKPVIVVSEDSDFILSARSTLGTAGFMAIHTITDDLDVLPFLDKTDAAVVALDLGMPRHSGLELLPRIREEHPHIPVIVIAGTREVERAVECVKAGAFDYLVKPVTNARFLSSVRNAARMAEPQDAAGSDFREVAAPPDESAHTFHGIATKNPGMKTIFGYIEAVASSRQPMLITGETGTGKELIARAVHELSGCSGVFIAVNVAGLDDAMFSDTLFGHRKGAFTGAGASREGLIARACGGTLFLDEIGDLENRSQVRILRLLEEKKYYPLGSDAAVETDARIVCATHDCVPGLVLSGEIRKDLYYRLCAHHVHMPPLRSRLEDLPLLLDQFLGEAARTLGRMKPTAPPELLNLLSAYEFPGNVRELKAMVFDAVTRHQSGVMSMTSFQKAIGENRHGRAAATAAAANIPADDHPFQLCDRFPTLREASEYLVSEAMRRSNNNRRIASMLLGITRDALKKRLSRNRQPAGK